MATQDPTVNYAWNLPNTGGDSGAWGTMLNAILGDDATGVDKRLFDATTTAGNALPKAGGTLTGLVEVKTDRYTVTNLGNLTGAIAVDLSTARFFYGTVTGTTTLSFTNPPASGKFVAFVLELTNPGGSVTWPASVKWPGGAAPAFTGAGVDIVSLYTRDGGTTWRAAQVQKDSR